MLRIGYNAAGAVGLIDNPPSAELVGLFGDIHCGVLRFMGGTVSQKANPTKEELDKAVALAKACGVPVLWVANIFSAPVETINALKAFRAGGVEVAGVEIGNETYADDGYQDLPGKFVKRAKIYADAVHAYCDRNGLPLIPVSLPIAPEPTMREVGEKPYVGTRLAMWNEVMFKAAFADALALHCYTVAMNATYYSQVQLPAFINKVTRRDPGKQLWITEHGLTDGHGTPAQGQHYANTLNAVRAFPQVSICTAHNLLSAEDAAFNFIEARAKGKYVLTQLGTTAAQQ